MITLSLPGPSASTSTSTSTSKASALGGLLSLKGPKKVTKERPFPDGTPLARTVPRGFSDSASCLCRKTTGIHAGRLSGLAPWAAIEDQGSTATATAPTATQQLKLKLNLKLQLQLQLKLPRPTRSMCPRPARAPQLIRASIRWCLINRAQRPPTSVRHTQAASRAMRPSIRGPSVRRASKPNWGRTTRNVRGGSGC